PAPPPAPAADRPDRPLRATKPARQTMAAPSPPAPCGSAAAGHTAPVTAPAARQRPRARRCERCGGRERLGASAPRPLTRALPWTRKGTGVPLIPLLLSGLGERGPTERLPAARQTPPPPNHLKYWF